MPLTTQYKTNIRKPHVVFLSSMYLVLSYFGGYKFATEVSSKFITRGRYIKEV